MLHLLPCSSETILEELQVLNSQLDYMEIAYKKRMLSIDDIRQQHSEAAEYDTQRYLVMDDEQVLALVDYGYSSPLQQLPWINLLCLHADYARKGYAKKVYELVEQNMYKDGVSEILLAVHANNKHAQQFWEKMQFVVFA